MDKKNLRLYIKQIRDNQDIKVKRVNEQAILDKLFSLDEIKECKSVFIYLSFKGEVDTFNIIQKLIQNNKEIYVPKVIGDKMVAVKYEAPFCKNCFGITEPINNIISENIDIAIVPLLAFDEKLDRVGYGKGYYDKYFYRVEALKIGIAFDFQKTMEIETQDTDIPLDYIITETKIYKGKN